MFTDCLLNVLLAPGNILTNKTVSAIEKLIFHQGNRHKHNFLNNVLLQRFSKSGLQTIIIRIPWGLRHANTLFALLSQNLSR